MDVLSDILSNAGWKTDLLHRKAIHKDWGFHFPCQKSGGFHIISQGVCHARFKGKLIPLEKGDILFIKRGLDHDLLSHPKAKIVDMSLLNKKEKETNSAIPVTTFVSSRFEVPERPQHPFFHELPEYILIKNADIPAHHPLQSTMILISSEIDSGIASDLILQRLTDILLYYVIRHWLGTNPSKKRGWIAALKDEKLLHALTALHEDIAKPWNLDSLAKTIGLSRATLATKFRVSLGVSPMDYLARLRIDKGRELMSTLEINLEEIAQKVGYSSAFSYSKAYKRINGVSPRRDWSSPKTQIAGKHL